MIATNQATGPMSRDAGSSIPQPPPITERFADLLEETLGPDAGLEGCVVKGTVLAINHDMVTIDVGLKAEGRVPLKEFSQPNQPADLKVGDEVEVYLDRIEDKNGEAMLSREKARREEAWRNLEESFRKGERVNGVIFGRVKGGFTVDLGGAVAFLPGSQVDIRPVRDITPLMRKQQVFQILKMDRSRGNVVISRRAILEESRAEERSKLIAELREGKILEGVVKNITDYGAFVDLGGVDGLLHVTDIVWQRISHPSEVLSVGQTVKVTVIRFNPDTNRISLGMKQLRDDPWSGIQNKYPVGTKFPGSVINITDYGAFVELEPGVEGLIHVSEMSWTKKNVTPSRILASGQQVEVMVLDVDPVRRRISLGLKQCRENPWEAFRASSPAGTEVEGEIKNITEFGLFVGLTDEIDGMVHLSDLDWSRPGEEALADYKSGERVRARVLDVDIEKERISLGIKQLQGDPFAESLRDGKYTRGSQVTGTVTAVHDHGIEVELGNEGNELPGYIRKSDLSRDRAEQRTDRFAIGERIDARIVSLDRAGRRVNLSIKQLEIVEEKQAMADYGSSDSGASLGDILGAALRKAGRVEGEASGDAAETDEDSPQDKDK